MALAITNARIVLLDSVLENGDLIVSGGLIEEFGPAGSLPVRGMQAIDARGAYLIPGIIDSHNDGVEGEINPRPRAGFPANFAIANYEMRAASSGVTTAFHAVMFADLLDKERTIRGASAIADMLHELTNPLIDHEVLYRLDVWTPSGLGPLFNSMRKAKVQAMSLNDHTPGQGQYRDLDELKKTLSAYLAKMAIRFDPNEIVGSKVSGAARNERPVEVLRRTRDEIAKEPFILLGHDPDTPEKIDELADLGVTIAEFPVTYAAAQRAREVGQWITMGAPNIVRGGSSSGNLSALRLARDGLLDILCGDYHAPSILYSAMLLYRQGICPLPESIAMITSNPAKSLSLTDRGRTAPGLAADLCLFTESGHIPRVLAVLKRGELIYSGGVNPELQHGRTSAPAASA